MKKRTQKKLSAGLALLFMLGMVQASLPLSLAKDFMQEQMLVSQHYQDIVSKEVQRVVPQGTFSVDTQVTLDESRLGAYLSQKNQEIDLPLSGLLGQKEAPVYVPAGVKSDLALPELLNFVKTKKVRMGFTEVVNPEFRNWIKQRVIDQTHLNTQGGDVIETYDLPKEFSASWVQWLQMGKPKWQSGDWTALWILLGGLTFLLVGAGIIVLFGVSTLSSRLSREVSKMSDTFSDSFQGGTSASMMNEKTKESSIEQQKHAQHEALADSKLLEKLDLDVLQAFCRDAASHEDYRFVPYSLIYHFLPNEKSEALEKSFSENEIPFPTAGEPVPTQAQVSQLLAANFHEYKNKAKNPFVKEVNQFSVAVLTSVAKTLQVPYSVILMDALLPQKKKVVSADIPVQTRLDWVKAAQSPAWKDQNWNPLKQQALQTEVLDQLKSFQGHQAVEPSHGFETMEMSVELLEVTSFEEDEQLYQSTRETPELYQGVLSMIQQWGPEVWKTVDARELAMMTFGYSQSIKDLVISKLEGKKVEWYKSFVQNHTQAHYSYQQNSVKSVRETYLNRFRAQSKNILPQQNQQEKDAA